MLNDWLREQSAALTRRDDLISENEIRRQSHEFLSAFADAWRSGDYGLSTDAWRPLNRQLGDLSRSRTLQGFSPTEIASFVFSFKQPLFARLRNHLQHAPERLADEMWLATTVLDKLGLYTTEVFQRSREDVIARQQQEMLELSSRSILQNR